MSRRTIHRLTAADLRRKIPGTYGDGGGLLLQVSSGKHAVNRSWVFRYTIDGRRREMGLGSTITISLGEARELALQCRKLRLAGVDPIERRKAARATTAAATAKAITFDECADRFVAAHRAGWRSAKHAAQWSSSVARYVSPVIGQLPVGAVDTALVMRVLEPLWQRAPVTGNHVRGRVEQVLDWAIARQYRQGPNPAAWRGHLDKLLPSHRKIRRVVHHPSIPYQSLPEFMVELRKRSGTPARALEFAILTAARSGEVLGLVWDELNFADKVWTVPGERMKSGRAHRVPLSPRCLQILSEMRAIRQGAYVFTGRTGGAPMWANALPHVLKQLGRTGVTVHGFRSAFRDWAGERTNFPREVAEAALAHQIGDSTERAYARGDALDKRRHLMDAWEKYCLRPPPAAW
jgi:integrase